jgi:hypothetical protein
MSVLMNHTLVFKLFNLGFGVRKKSKEMNYNIMDDEAFKL